MERLIFRFWEVRNFREQEQMMEELGTIQDLLMAHDFYIIDSKVEEIGRAVPIYTDPTEESGG